VHETGCVRRTEGLRHRRDDGDHLPGVQPTAPRQQRGQRAAWRVVEHQHVTVH